MKIVQEGNLRAPSSPCSPYRDEEDAARKANNSPYGLSGAVYTADPERGYQMARRVRTGSG